MRIDELRWVLLRTFYQSYRTFSALFGGYERRVLEFSARYDVNRRDLKLPPDELRSLIDSEALLGLRDGELQPLRDISHQIFRGAYLPDPFDSHVTNIYHEVSILKEEHWTIGDPTTRLSREEYDRYYREVNVYYPRRLRHVRNLYGKAIVRLEQLLPSMARTKIIVRSMYLFGDRLALDVYEGGIAELYGHMYPSGGALTGYALAADSFAEGGFWHEAAAAYEQALETLAHQLGCLPIQEGAPGKDRALLEEQKVSLLKRLAQVQEKA